MTVNIQWKSTDVLMVLSIADTQLRLHVELP